MSRPDCAVRGPYSAALCHAVPCRGVSYGVMPRGTALFCARP